MPRHYLKLTVHLYKQKLLPTLTHNTQSMIKPSVLVTQDLLLMRWHLTYCTQLLQTVSLLLPAYNIGIKVRTLNQLTAKLSQRLMQFYLQVNLHKN